MQFQYTKNYCKNSNCSPHWLRQQYSLQFHPSDPAEQKNFAPKLAHSIVEFSQCLNVQNADMKLKELYCISGGFQEQKFVGALRCTISNCLCVQFGNIYKLYILIQYRPSCRMPLMLGNQEGKVFPENRRQLLLVSTRNHYT